MPLLTPDISNVLKMDLPMFSVYMSSLSLKIEWKLVFFLFMTSHFYFSLKFKTCHSKQIVIASESSDLRRIYRNIQLSILFHRLHYWTICSAFRDEILMRSRWDIAALNNSSPASWSFNFLQCCQQFPPPLCVSESPKHCQSWCNTLRKKLIITNLQKLPSPPEIFYFII